MMKKTLLALAFLSAVSAGLFADAALPDSAPFISIWDANISPEKLETIRSFKFVYKLTGSNVPDSIVVIRAKRYDKMRLDILTGNSEHLCASTDGEAFWVYNKKEGRIAMDEGDVTDFKRYMAFMPVTICKDPVFSDAVKIGTEDVNGVSRTGYEAKPLEALDKDVAIRMWIESKSHVLRKAEAIVDGERTRVTFYRDYRDYNGIKTPVYISFTNKVGPMQLELISAAWNLEIDDVLFTRKGKLIDNELESIINSPSSPAVKEAAEQKRKANAKIEQLERKINKLKLEIAACEKDVNRAEQIETVTRSSSTGLSSINSDTGGHTYYWGGYGHGGGTHSSTNIRRKQVNLLNDEKKDATRSYERKSQKLLQLQIDLSNAEYELKKLQSAQEEAQNEGLF